MRILTSLTLAMFALGLCAASGPALRSETDDKIESSFKKSYVYRTYLKNDAVSISSKDGKVTLSGTVTDENHKTMAQDTAEALPSVTGVENRIMVIGQKVEEHSDAWIATRIKAMLFFHRNVSVGRTEVDVKDGEVVLSGEAMSQAEKELTTEYAKDVEGVKSVKNKMTVAAPTDEKKSKQSVGEAMDDASIIVQVKFALMFHRSTSAIRTKVESKNGVVTLTGKAKNAAEKDLVTELAEDVNGVTKVVNEMTIETPADKG